MSNGILTAISKETGKQVKSISFFMVISDGNVKNSFDDYDMAKGLVDNINEQNAEDICEELDVDMEDLSDKEMGEMQFMGGYYGEHAYVEKVQISEDYNLDDDYETQEEDLIKYSDIKNAYLNRNTEYDFLSNIDDEDDDIDEDDDDFNLV